MGTRIAGLSADPAPSVHGFLAWPGGVPPWPGFGASVVAPSVGSSAGLGSAVSEGLGSTVADLSAVGVREALAVRREGVARGEAFAGSVVGAGRSRDGLADGAGAALGVAAGPAGCAPGHLMPGSRVSLNTPLMSVTVSVNTIAPSTITTATAIFRRRPL
ncbi:hypothetical protein J5X84_39680 [Streptosporangiaceae bacterium NEAU-GS5]|nr:hypothetical protein [Streptosporangiaceae bacterium NEAU-GS5]